MKEEEISEMRILTENLKSVQKIWSQVRVKGVAYNDYVLLDFDNKCLAFYNLQTVVKVPLELEDNDGQGLSHRSMFVDGSKFFSLVQFYDYVDIDKDDVFYSSLGDRFIVPEIKEEINVPDQEYNDWETFKVEFTPDLNKKLSLSLSYVEPDPKSDFSALFIHQGTLIACNRYKMFFAETSNGLEEIESNLPLALLKLIVSLDMTGEVEFKVRTDKDENKTMEFTYGNLWLRYYSSSRFVLPFEPESEDFQSAYNHPNYFSVKVSQMSEAIKFLSAYYNDTVDAVCKCVFDTESQNSDDWSVILHLSYEQSGTSDFRVKIESCTDPEFFNGKAGFIYLNYIKTATGILEQLGVETMRITFDEDGAAMAFKDDKEECPVFLVHTVTEEI